MMTVVPLRFREAQDEFLFADEAGQFFMADSAFLERYVFDKLNQHDRSFLKSNGHSYEHEEDFYFLSYLRRWSSRQTNNKALSYVILVPTLRCDLRCSYCQVSRVSERARGFDWDDHLVRQVFHFLGTLETDEIKIEFQGGEPLLRLDLLKRVKEFCEANFLSAEFVVCTNLQKLDDDKLEFLGEDKVLISTSLDGAEPTHEKNRTKDAEKTGEFFANLELVINRFGVEKVSALPTVDYSGKPNLSQLLDTYTRYGLQSIYLRPVNYHGFARKKFAYVRNDAVAWNALYERFLDQIVEYNFRNRVGVEEYYFSLCLHRVLRAGLDSHVDLRNPNLVGTDYVVIDFDGKLYPSDEARMISRTGQIDLAIGHVSKGIEKAKPAELNLFSLNNFHEDCTHCPYQPFCGTDLVDDISRYGRIDLPKADTSFCQRHLMIFDKVFKFLYSQDEKVRYSLARWIGMPDYQLGLGATRHDTSAS